MGKYDIDAYTKLLLHCNGADTSTIFTDDSPSVHGNAGVVATAEVDTAVKKFGTGSLLLDGDSGYLTYGASADWFLNTGDFTIDFWMLSSKTSGGNGLIGNADTTPGHWRITTRESDFNNLAFAFNDGSWRIVSTSFDVNDGVQHHIAVSRASGTFYILVDGDLKETNAGFSGLTVGEASQELRIGFSVEASLYYEGWLDEIRISIGIARWIANFNPPANPYGFKASGGFSGPSSALWNFMEAWEKHDKIWKPKGILVPEGI